MENLDLVVWFRLVSTFYTILAKTALLLLDADCFILHVFNHRQFPLPPASSTSHGLLSGLCPEVSYLYTVTGLKTAVCASGLPPSLKRDLPIHKT